MTTYVFTSFDPPLVLDAPRAYVQQLATDGPPPRLPPITPMRQTVLSLHLNWGVGGIAPVLGELFREPELVRAYLEPFAPSGGDLPTLQHPLDLIALQTQLALSCGLPAQDAPFIPLVLSLGTCGALLLRYWRLNPQRQAASHLHERWRRSRHHLPNLHEDLLDESRALNRWLVAPCLDRITKRDAQSHTQSHALLRGLLEAVLEFDDQEGLQPLLFTPRELPHAPRVARLIQARRMLLPGLVLELLALPQPETLFPAGQA